MSETLGTPRSYWRIGAWGVAAALLLVPLVAMQFNSEMNWGSEDFIAAALLIGGAGLAFELAVRLVHGVRARVTAGLAIAGVFALIWAQLAVGLF